MKTALIAGALLVLAATALVAAPTAAAQPPPTLPCGASLEDGYVYCQNPVGRGCVWLYFGDGTWACSG